MTELTFQQATPEEAESLAEVYQSAYQQNRDLGFPAKAESATPNTIRTWIHNAQLYTAKLGDDVVGGIRLEETDTDRVKLSRFGVHEKWKGNGIGSKLLRYAEDRAHEQGYTTIWLTTPGEHPFLPELYRRHGYEKTGEYSLEYREYDEIIMEKKLP